MCRVRRGRMKAGGSWSAGSKQFFSVYSDGFRRCYGEGRRRDIPSQNGDGGA